MTAIAQSAPKLSPGEVADRFWPRELAGEGGSAEVWKAEDRRDGGLVALKLARDDEGRRAFAREAIDAALRLSPRLPELVDLGWTAPRGEGERRAFLALRWVEGEPLLEARARCRGDARLALALAVARDVGEALADLHAAGLSHGDVKPGNLVVGDDGRVHVLDLGLAGSAERLELDGGTPRYLAHGDAELGVARSRDLVALGAVLAELCDDGVRGAHHAIEAAREAHLPAPLDGLCAALLAPSPGARPSAAWVVGAARAALAGDARRDEAERAEADARRVRATYLKLRRAELASAHGAAPSTAPWLAEAITLAQRARAIAGHGDVVPPGPLLPPLGPDGIARWLTALVGSDAAGWPVHAIVAAGEPAVAAGLASLARRVTPAAWTLGDVERAVAEAVAGEAPASGLTPRPIEPFAAELRAPIDAASAARLALAITMVPPDAAALALVERRRDVPRELALAAADALRLRGELGRARALVLRYGAGDEAGPLAAEILRRAGDVALARHRASDAIARGADAGGRARATLARIAIDAGKLDEADAILRGEASLETAALCEARGLVAARRGDLAAALAEIARGEALARNAEERARLAALRGYACHATDPGRAKEAYAAAVDHAVRAGAVVEEATYRTGEAAAAENLGDLGVAIATARRAALLWEHLGRPAMAARALLAVAAAYATAGCEHDTAAAAREAIARAREAGDRRAEAFAWWAIADAGPIGSDAAAQAAGNAAALLEGGSAEDQLRAAARVLRHDVARSSAPALAAAGADAQARIAALDRRAGGEGVSAAARLEWWGARAATLEPPERADGVLAALVALAEAPAPAAARGPALAAGIDLAARAGQGEIAQRLLAALGDAARDLTRRAPPELADAVRALPWVARAAAGPAGGGLRPEQSRDLEALIRSLGERERLSPLLVRVVDALVLWTGVERGLMLLRAPDGRLVPRAARNLARADLGGEQMALSQTLARRALEAREPVVAIDAAGELPSVHQSVHALKLRSVLAVPLIARGEALGVVYLDDRVRRGAFGARELDFTRTIAALAALAIADARDQVMLRRAARRAQRAGAALAETLARREALLDATERELRRARGADARGRHPGIVGASEPMQALLRVVDRVGQSDVPVLLVGESGSGKELVARACAAGGAPAGGPRGGGPGRARPAGGRAAAR